MKPTLIVMAAGIGSRYGGLKQIDPVGPHGEIIIDYSLFDALRAGFGKVVFVVTSQLETAFRDKVGKIIEQRCETIYIHQEIQNVPAGFQIPPGRNKPWGTAHAVLSCRNVVDGPFAVINADDYYGRTSFERLGHFLQTVRDGGEPFQYALVGYKLENTLTEYGHVARGVCSVNQQGHLTYIRERTHVEKFDDSARYTEDGHTWVTLPRDTLVSMNMWGFTPSLFGELENHFPLFLNQHNDNILTVEYFLPNVVGDLLQEQKAVVQVLPTSERWFGVTYRQDKPRVRQAIAGLVSQGVYPVKLWEAIQ